MMMIRMEELHLEPTARAAQVTSGLDGCLLSLGGQGVQVPLKE